MNSQLHDFISKQESAEFATKNGLAMHAKLQFVRMGNAPTGDAELIKKIESCGDKLKSFFGENSRSEVPIASIINGKFISRRIDRLVVDDISKTVRILDYKTDIDTNKFRDKYIAQIHEYAGLLKQIYPEYKISGYILWLHDWTLESI